LACAAAAALATGCAKDEARPVYSLPAGMAGLFVINHSDRAVFNAKQPVSDGGQVIAQVEPRRYAFVPIAVGEHSFHCDNLSMTREVPVTAVAGQIYYLKLEMVETPQIQHCALITPKDATGYFPDVSPQDAK
jgi:hypothetical protein